MRKRYHYFLFNKPYGVLSQFTDADGHPGIGSVHHFPKSVYPIGRLDHDSEGLLLLTSDRSITEQVLNPEYAHKRTYLAQLDGQIDNKSLQQLKDGVQIKADKAMHRVKAFDVQRTDQPSWLPEREPPVKPSTGNHSWIKVTLTEGKNRQVRKMTAAAGFPTLRLVRLAIEDLSLANLPTGASQKIPKPVFYKGLKLSST